MKVGSGSSTMPRHAGTAARTPSSLPPSLFRLSTSASGSSLLFYFRGAASRREQEKRPSGIYETYQTLRHVRELAGKFLAAFSFLLFFRSFFSPATLTRILRSLFESERKKREREREKRAQGRRSQGELSRKGGGRGQRARRSSLAKLSHQKSLEIVL